MKKTLLILAALLLLAGPSWAIPPFPPGGGTTAGVSDTAYNETTWDGVTDTAPSKNAVRDKFFTVDAALALKQASHANLTSVSGLTYSEGSFVAMTGATTFALRTYAQVLSDIGAAASGHNHDGTYQAASANLTTFAGISPSANVQTLLGSADYAAFRTNLSLVPGTDVQAADAELTGLAALSYSEASYVRMTAAGTFDLRTYANVLSDIGAGDITAVLDDTGGDVPALIQSATAFTINDETPSVSGHSVFITANAATPTTITDFDDPTAGQIIFVIINDVSTTIDFTSSGIEGRDADYACTNGEVLIFVYASQDSQWHYLGNWQKYDADLTTIAALAPAENKIIVGNSTPVWSLSAYTLAAPSTSGNIMKSDGTNWTSSNSLSIATLDLTSSTSSIPCPVGTAAAPTDEGKFYWNSTNDALTVGTGAAAKVFIGEGAATGGLLFGDSTPDAAGEVGYGSGKFGFYGANSEDIYINVGSAANTVTVGTNTDVSDISLGAINLLTTGTIAGRVPIGSDITGNISLNTTDLIGKVYFVTAACTITLDKVSDVGFGAVVGFYVRDVSETVIIEIDDADKIKLYGTALDAGDTIDSPGAAGDYIFLMSVTDADGAGTDGWVTFGGSGTWTDGGAT